jgi:hypothetical protein
MRQNVDKFVVKSYNTEDHTEGLKDYRYHRRLGPEGVKADDASTGRSKVSSP